MKLNKVVQLEKTFRFETAHRLGKGYVGKCNNIHGHSWNGKIVVSCGVLNDYDMGVDYADLKQITKLFEDKYDHKLVLYSFDPLAETFKNADYHNGIIHLDKNPTSETIAEDLWSMAEVYIVANKMNCTLHSIVIEETCTTRCVYKKKY